MSENVWLQMKYKKPANQVLIGFRREIEKEDELKLAREGGQTTVQHLAELESLRRYATLTALVLELTATLTDEALNMFEHLVGQLFKRSERAHAEQFHASGKSINEKVRLYARVGQALIEARSSGGCAPGTAPARG